MTIIKTEDGGGVWINIYKAKTSECDIYWTGSVGYSTKENACADLADRQHYIATIDIRQALCAMKQNAHLKNVLNRIIDNGPCCQHDDDCPLNNGEGFDQGCATCSVVLARKGLKDGSITKHRNA